MKAIPNEVEYDVLHAKLSASLLWFVCRLSENGFQNIPQQVTSPMDVTSQKGPSVHPVVIDYLTDGGMYLYIGSVLFKQEFTNLWDLIQKMSHTGVYVMCENDQAVTDQDLVSKSPFNLLAHLSLMDSIQIVYGNSVVTVGDVLGVIRSISTFNAAKEMPFDVEDALVLWLSKISEIISADLKREERGHTESSAVLSRNLPVVKTVCESFENTKTMLSLLLFYMPDFVGAESMKLASNLTVYEKASNIELFRCLCAEHICTSVFSLRMEDMLFAKEPLKPNFLALLCEMFYKIELEGKDMKLYNKETTEDVAMMHRNESSMLPHQQHQLLTRRSKKVLGSLNSDSDNPELMFDDMDLTRSRVVPANPNRHESILVSQAWAGDSPTNDGKKPGKINLNFRPDYGSFTSRTTASRNSDIDNSASYSLPGSLHASKNSMNPPSLHYAHPYSGVRSSYDYLALYPENDYQSFCGSSIAENWHDMEKGNSYNERPPLPPHGSHFTSCDKKGISGPANIMQHSDIDEDALSTITEITEPDRISNYSFHSSSSSVATKASNDELDEEGKSLNTTLQSSDNVESKMESSGTYMQVNQIPPDDVLLATLSKTFKDMGKQIRSNTSEKHNLQDVVENVENGSPLLPLNTSLVNSPVSAPRSLGSPEKMIRGSYTVKHGTRESAILSGHPIITESIKESYDHFNTRVKSDLARREAEAWYLTQSGLPPISIDEENHSNDDCLRGETNNSLDNPSNTTNSYNVSDISVNNTNDISLPSLSNEISLNEEKLNEIQNSCEEQNTKFENNPQLSSSVHDINKSSLGNDITNIQNDNFELNVKDSVMKLNGMNKLSTLWNTTEKMILHSMVKTTDNNMVFNKTFASRELHSLKHLSSISSKNSFSDDARMLSGTVEKIRFTASNLSTSKNIENDSITWIDLFSTNDLDIVERKVNNEIIKKNQDKLKRYKSSLTSWADQPHITCNGGNKDEDETLSVQLAALRMQLEEKQRRFKEEKEKKQDLWRKERAKSLQNAFFLMLRESEQHEGGPSAASTEYGDWDDLASSQLVNSEYTCEEVKSLSNDVPDSKASYTVEGNNNEIPVKPTSENVILSSVEPDHGQSFNISDQPNKLYHLQENYHANVTQEQVSLEPSQKSCLNPLETVCHTADDPSSVKLDQSLSTLMKDFSPFSKPEITPIVPVGFTTQESISSVLNQLGSPEDPHQTLLKKPYIQGNVPQTSVVLNQLADNYNSVEMAAAETHEVNIDNKLIVDNKALSSYSSETKSMHESSQPGPTGATVDASQAASVDGNQLPYSQSDSVLEQGMRPTAVAVQHKDIVPNDEAPGVSAVQTLPKTWDVPDSSHEQIALQDTELSTAHHNQENLSFTDANIQTQDTETQGHVNDKTNSENAQSINSEDTEKSPVSMAFAIGVDMMEYPGLTPQQIKKRERFLRQRQKNMAEEKEKKAAEISNSTFHIQKQSPIIYTPKKVPREEVAGTPKRMSKEEHVGTPKRASREECRKELSSQEHKKEVGNLYHETLLKAVGSDLQDTPTRTGKRDVPPPRSPRTPQNPITLPNSASDEASRYAEYTGPDAYKKPSGKSNRKIIQNAIMHCCLCGEVNKEAKKKCLDAMEKSTANHFLVLFREGLKFRSVYEYHPDTETVTRVYGIGPKTINEKMMIKYYKYNSGGKEFYLLETKHLSIQVDGLMIKKELWDKKQGNNSKTDSNLKKGLGNSQRQGP